ncbi:MAG: polysaccharide biosynthesis C-terminal domain-containing protein, partial [Muribaculaceae bacterium]|nr:polysaccharide biosynthesis C-terminal domain-containing protein [Muribaculaceae bacterium]
GAIFSGIGCAVLILVNVLFVPKYGYIACAWGGFAGYGTAMILSYIVGQKYYPIPYALKSIAFYVAIAGALFAAMVLVPTKGMWLTTLYRTVLLLVFAAVIYKHEHLAPLMKKLPVVGRFFR